MKFLAGFGRYLITFLLIGFCAVSIFFSLVERGIDSSNHKNFLSYASFFEDRFYDHRMGIGLDRQAVNEDLVLAAIDDTTLQKMGRWPLPRENWVKLLQKFSHFGAKVLAFDVIFPEPEVSCHATSPDDNFAGAIRNFQQKSRSVIISYSMADPGEESFKEIPGHLYNFVLNTKQSGDYNLIPRQISSQTFPIDKIVEAEPGLGHISVQGDASDGIFRHYPLLANVDTLYLPSLGLLAYQKYSGDEIALEIQEGNIKLQMKKGTLKLNHFGETKIRFFGGSQNFRTVGLYEILSARPNDPHMTKLLKDKLVFIGSTAFAAHDLRHTPVDAQLPGVYFHMNLVDMLIKGRFFKDKEQSLYFSLALLLLGSILLLIIQRARSAILDLVVVTLLGLATYFVDTYYLLPQGYEIKLFFCLLAFLSCYFWNTFINFYLTSKEKTKIKGTFSRYVAPSIVNEMLSNPDKLKVGGEKRNITVIFSDVRDFTSISEKLTPQQLSLCLNQYMGKMTDILFETYGTLDKYIGDALVGFWGAPMDLEHHAYHGVRGALQMVEALPAINESFRDQGFPEFKVGLGLNTGDCSVGNMGSEKIFSYTALGDNMNLGSRLEGLCKFYGTQIIISEFTLEGIPEDLRKEFTFRTLDKVKVKGKETAVKIIEVLPSAHPMRKDPQALEGYERAYSLYLERKFQEALIILEDMLKKFPLLEKDKSTLRLKSACEDYITNPPPADWDGVTAYKEK